MPDIIMDGKDLYTLVLFAASLYIIFNKCLFGIDNKIVNTDSKCSYRRAMLGRNRILVLYFTKFTSSSYEWINMLLDFIIYGGGLGASLITVRMIAERYFLVIQNGVKSGLRIPIHKWMNATGGGNKVSIGMTGECEIQMNWEKAIKWQKNMHNFISIMRKVSQ